MLSVAFARASDEPLWAWAAVAAFAAALVSTLVFNVPVNLVTGRWDADHPPAGWKQARARWERFQGVRSWLLLAGFVLVCTANTTS